MTRLLFTASGWVLLGIIVIVIGVTIARDGFARQLPEKSGLTPVAGAVQRVAKVSTKARFGNKMNTEYVIDVRPGDGGLVELRVPEDKINQATANSLSGMPVTALLRGTAGGVWELKAGNNTLLDYETERALFANGLASEARNGPFIIAGGTLILLAGLYRLYRRRAAGAYYH